jgi:hypothetical protein
MNVTRRGGNKLQTIREMKMAEVWSRLTEHLFIQILATLPIKAISRFHALCKQWNEKFWSSDFKELTSSNGLALSKSLKQIRCL